jgi:hypothetical protein
VLPSRLIEAENGLPIQPTVCAHYKLDVFDVISRAGRASIQDEIISGSGAGLPQPKVGYGNYVGVKSKLQ